MDDQNPAKLDEHVKPSDDDHLDFAQMLRRRMVESHMVDGEIPNDHDKQKLMLTALADMDRNSLGRKRIASDDANAANDRATAEEIARITQDPNLFRPNGQVINHPPAYDAEQMPHYELLPGETQTGHSVINYDDIMADTPNAQKDTPSESD